jgi:hypothetical protein
MCTATTPSLGAEKMACCCRGVCSHGIRMCGVHTLREGRPTGSVMLTMVLPVSLPASLPGCDVRPQDAGAL